MSEPEQQAQPAGPGSPARTVPATFVAWAIAVVNVGLWVVPELMAGPRGHAVFELGANFGPLVDRGQYWRLLTSVFLHGGLAHLAFNSAALLSFGRIGEMVYGHVRFLVIYLLSGIAGSTASYAFTHGLSVGASGALFGVAAALVVFFARNRRLAGVAGRNELSGYVLLLAINVVFGLTQPSIDNWGHLGGMIGGAALGLFLTPRLVAVRGAEGEVLGVRARRSPIVTWMAVPAALAILAWLIGAIRATHSFRG